MYYFVGTALSIVWILARAPYFKLFGHASQVFFASLGLSRHSLFAAMILSYCLFSVFDVFFVQVVPSLALHYNWLYLAEEADGLWIFAIR
jgi:hypothetical protein